MLSDSAALPEALASRDLLETVCWVGGHLLRPSRSKVFTKDPPMLIQDGMQLNLKRAMLRHEVLPIAMGAVAPFGNSLKFWDK